MSAMAYLITGVSIVCLIVGSGADKKRYQSPASLGFLRGIPEDRWINSPHKRPVTRKTFPLDDVIMYWTKIVCAKNLIWLCSECIWSTYMHFRKTEYHAEYSDKIACGLRFVVVRKAIYPYPSRLIQNHTITPMSVNMGKHITISVIKNWLYNHSNTKHNTTVCVFHALRWRHNGRDSVSNHQPHDCLLNRLFIRRSKKTLKLRVTGLCAGEFTGDRWIPRTNGQ